MATQVGRVVFPGGQPGPILRGGPQGAQNFRDPTYANMFDLERPNLAW